VGVLVACHVGYETGLDIYRESLSNQGKALFAWIVSIFAGVTITIAVAVTWAGVMLIFRQIAKYNLN